MEVSKINNKIMRFIVVVILNFSSIYALGKFIYDILKKTTISKFTILIILLILLIISYIDIKYIFNQKYFSNKIKYIRQIKKYLKNRRNEKLNNIYIRELQINYNIGKKNSELPLSNVDINTIVRGSTLESDLKQYHLFYTKNTLGKDNNPNIIVKNNNCDNLADVELLNDVPKINHFIARFEKINIHCEFVINTRLNDCYCYSLNKGDTYIIYPHSYGKEIRQIKIEFVFEDNIFKDKYIIFKKGDLSYIRNITTLFIKQIKYRSKDEKYFSVYTCDEKFSDNEFLIIELPKIKE